MNYDLFFRTVGPEEPEPLEGPGLEPLEGLGAAQDHPKKKKNHDRFFDLLHPPAGLQLLFNVGCHANLSAGGTSGAVCP